MKTEVTKTVKISPHKIRITQPIFVAGQLVRAETIVEVSALDARDLINSRRAVEATAAEVTAAGSGIVVAPIYERLNSKQWAFADE